MRAAIGLVALLLSLVPARAENWAIGVGAKSCAFWLSTPVLQAAGVTWITGFWSGLNYVSDKTVGMHTDNEGLFAEIKKICQEHPSKDLTDATWEVYRMIEDQHR
jgi:hypothetical protein